jgi:hypothetical protein
LLLAQMMLGPKTTGLPFGTRLKNVGTRHAPNMATHADEAHVWFYYMLPPPEEARVLGMRAISAA